MKTRTLFLISLLSGLVFCSSYGYAQIAVKSGSLQVTSLSREMLTVELKGPQVFEESFSGSIIFSNLLPGEYLLTFSTKSPQQRSRGPRMNQQLVCIDQEQRIYCKIDERGRYTSYTTIDRNSTLLILSGRNYNDRSAPHDFHGGQLMPETINQTDLNRMAAAMAKANFDSDRDKILYVSAEYCFYRADQVKQLLSTFLSDNKKLEWAKRLVPKVVDQYNLYMISEAFTFLSSKNEYANFLKTLQAQPR